MSGFPLDKVKRVRRRNRSEVGQMARSAGGFLIPLLFVALLLFIYWAQSPRNVVRFGSASPPTGGRVTAATTSATS